MSGDETISVRQTGGGDPLRFDVTIGQGGTRHAVTLAAHDLARFGRGDGAALIEAAFVFLLAREPREAILSRFDFSVIARYFPDFPDYLEGLR